MGLRVLFIVYDNGAYDNIFPMGVGALAAAQSTESIGNKNSVSKIKILKTLEHLLK